MLWNNPDLLGKTTDPESAAKEWPNFGGDKLWPAPQDRWNWPPDPVIDSGHLLVQALPNHHLLITGQPGSKLGVQFTREITLAPTGTEVTLKNTMRNVSSQKQTWGIWEVFQTNAPTQAGMPLSRSGHFTQGYFNFGKTPPPGATTDKDMMLFTRDPANSYKVGSDAPTNTLWADIQDQRFEISARYEPGQTYPDSGCSEEVYSDPDPLPYMELELLAPIHILNPGKMTTFITHWRIESKT